MSFFRKIKKKHLILAALVVLLAAVSVVNFKYFNTAQTVSEDDDDPYNAELVTGDVTEDEVMSGGSISAEFFAEYRLERERTRSENIETLNLITENEKSSAESIENAQNEIVALVKQNEQELTLENLIKSKGFEECVVFLHQGYVNVLVDAKSLTPEQAIQIQDIVATECSVELSKITVAASGK